MLFCLDWSKFKKKKVSSNNLEANKLFEKRDEVESAQLLQDDSEYKHRVQRPEGFETLCRSDPSCPEDCDACCQLPYNNKTGASGSYQWHYSNKLGILDIFLDIFFRNATNPWNEYKARY